MCSATSVKVSTDRRRMGRRTKLCRMVYLSQKIRQWHILCKLRLIDYWSVLAFRYIDAKSRRCSGKSISILAVFEQCGVNLRRMYHRGVRDRFFSPACPISAWFSLDLFFCRRSGIFIRNSESCHVLDKRVSRAQDGLPYSQSRLNTDEQPDCEG